MRGPGPGTRVVLDWDGTATEADSLSLVMERFGDFGLWRSTGRRMGRSLTHDEAIARSFATVQAPLAEVVEWLLANVGVRAGFHELVRRYRPLIVSSGFRELIDPILEREGVRVAVLANHIEARADGWRIRFRERETCPTCGEPCKRASLPGRDVVYVGDGYSDRCAALAARRVFATESLARYLTARGIPYQPFDDLHDVLDALEAGAIQR
jgi:2-hydroxy-3-keto-5-methylthiopentenyl-1-phosphate phosphatase